MVKGHEVGMWAVQSEKIVLMTDGQVTNGLACQTHGMQGYSRTTDHMF
jgi:hypothetical protein